MSYYWFNRKEILQKAKEKYSKEKAAEYYLENREAIKSQKIDTKTCHKKNKTRLKSTKEKSIQNWFGVKKKGYKINNFCFFSQYNKNERKTLKFDNNRVNKKEFHKSKQAIVLNVINADQIVVSNKFKHSDDSFKYFIGDKKGKIVKPLYIVLPQMNGYRKYFENGGKNMSFFIKDDGVLDIYNEIWDKIKKS